LHGGEAGGEISGDEVGFESGDFLVEEFEPEYGELREEAAFAGDAVSEDHVVGGDAVCCDEEEGCGTEGVDVPDFAAGEEVVLGERCGRYDGFVHGDRKDGGGN
jgi:hypothetical protein